MDDPATAQTSLGAIAPGHTGLIYDALELVQDDAEQYNSSAFTAQIEPTIFYRETKAGMAEVVDVFISRLHGFPRATLWNFESPGIPSADHSTTDNEFGEARLEFEVPEWTGAAEATVRIGRFSAPASRIEPAKKWTIALIPHEHLDIGFTDYPRKSRNFTRNRSTQAMDLIKKTPDFRWTLDGSWVADQYLNGRSLAGARAVSRTCSRRQYRHPAGVRQSTYRERIVGRPGPVSLRPAPSRARIQIAVPSRCGANCGCPVLHVGLRFGSA